MWQRAYNPWKTAFAKFLAADDNASWKNEPLFILDGRGKFGGQTHPLEQIRWTHEKKRAVLLFPLPIAGAECGGNHRETAPHIRDISFRIYYRRRREAIDALSSILWGYTSKDSIDILEQFFPEDRDAGE